MRDIIEFEGKRYPRYWGGNNICLSEACAHLHATSYKIDDGSGGVTITSNFTDVPEGTNIYSFVINNATYNTTNKIYIVDKRLIDGILREYNLPLCDDVDPLAEKKADLAAKEQKADKLKPVADAATFAIEHEKGNVCDGTFVALHAHWRTQEHAYLVAQSEVETAKKALHKCSLS